MSGLPSRRLARLALHGTLVLAGAVVFAPVLWVMAAGFRTQISLLTGEFFFTPVLSNFAEVLFSKTSDFLLNFRNSLVVGLISTALCLAMATLAAWSLHRMRWPGWVPHIFLGWALVFHMIPPVALAGSWFTMMRQIGLDNSFTGLILAHTTLNLPMALWLMGVFVREAPARARGGGADRRRVDTRPALEGGSAPDRARASPRRRFSPSCSAGMSSPLR